MLLAARISLLLSSALGVQDVGAPASKPEIAALQALLSDQTDGDWSRTESRLIGLKDWRDPDVVRAVGALAAKLQSRQLRPGSATEANVFDLVIRHGDIRASERAYLALLLAGYLSVQKQHERALQLLDQALEAEPSYAFDVAVQRADIHTYRGETDAAARCRQMARSSAKSDVEHLRIDVMDADVTLRLGLVDAASGALRSARARLDKIESSGGADVSYDKKRYLVCELDYRVALDDAESVRDTAAQLLSLCSPMEVFWQRARLAQVVSGIESGTRDAAIAELESLLRDAAPAHKPTVVLFLLEQMMVAGREAEAVAVAEQWRGGRSLLDLALFELVGIGCVVLRPAGIRAMSSTGLGEWLTALDAVWARLVRPWQSAAPEQAGVAFLRMRERRSLLSLWMRTRMAVGGDMAARDCLQRYLEVEAMGSLAKRLGVEAPEVNDVARSLGADGAVAIAYMPSYVGSFVFVVRDAKVAAHEISPDRDWLPAIGRIQRVLGAPDLPADMAQFESDRQMLAAQVLTAPIVDAIADASLVTIAGRELCLGLRLECLPFRGESLGTAKAIANVPSMVVAAHLQRRGLHEADADVELLAGTKLADADAKRWSMAPIDVSASDLAACFAAVDDRAVRIRRDATVDDLLRSGGSRDLLCVLAHGIFDGEQARAAGFLLGGVAERSGAVFGRDLVQGALQTNVVFLGVCGANRGAVKRGDDGVQRLSAACIEAGARAVLVAETDLRLDDCLSSVSVVTDALAAGASVAEAARLARTQIASHVSHPGRWAAVCVEGLGGIRMSLPVASSRPASSVYPVSGVILVATLVALWLRRQRVSLS